MGLKMWITCITPCITSFYGIFRGKIVDNFSTCFPHIPQKHMFRPHFLCILLFLYFSIRFYANIYYSWQVTISENLL
jgi:hypothetical protein